MQIRTDITPDELSQAVRLNRTRMYWMKVFWANLYAPLFLIMILWTEIGRMIDGKPMQPLIFGFLLVPAFFVWLYWYRTHRSVRNTASQLSDPHGSASIDGKGISVISSTGATSFVPWREFTGWKEAKDVFTLTTAKSFRAFTKRGLSEDELAQLRSIFRTQIH